MKILVRLPNWLGDMVMAVGFIDQLNRTYPGAEVSVIVKMGIDALLPYFPPLKHVFVFNKTDYKGVRGAWRFGRMTKAEEDFDLFFSLPDSFSAGLMGFATGAKQRIGFAKEGRGFLFTQTYRKPEGLHRVEEYVSLAEQFTGKKANGIAIELNNPFPIGQQVVVNINSEASSRRLTVTKAVELITALRNSIDNELVLIGAPKEKPFIDSVYNLIPHTAVINGAGNTSLPQLVELLGRAKLLLTTDSGPAHLGNALGTPTVVLFGAGNENNTAPYNKSKLQAIRLGKLSCEPCRKNVCVRYDVPQCLEQLDSYGIIAVVKKELERHE